MAAIAAVDLGASSGRVMVAQVSAVSGVALTEVNRFWNGPVRVGDRLHWDVLALYRGILEGLRAAGRVGPLAGVGIDSWAVDYGLLDEEGRLLGNPVHYRDERTSYEVIDGVHDLVSPVELYARTGLQHLPFNTLYQLAAEPLLPHAAELLLIPDLVSRWLTGESGAEVTNASTTGLLDVATREWSQPLLTALGLPASILATLREPGTPAGTLLPSVLAETGLSGSVPVTAVGSHDTASAVLAVPATTRNFAYISCGTWSLVGVELDQPVLTDASRAANFTNELGVDGTVRYLRNVMGLWLLSESQRAWETAGRPADLATLLDQAAAAPGGRHIVDPDHPSFLPPGDMPARIAAYLQERGEPVPTSQAEFVRCILDSLAAAYRTTVRQAAELSGIDPEVVHVVGGGSRNALLCQLTADACGLPVVAGPVEAAALGNVLVQARTLGLVSGGLSSMRELLSRHEPLTHYHPS